jgi:hypothetical protein
MCGIFEELSFDNVPYLQYLYGMKSVMLTIHDDSKIDSLLTLLRDLRYVEVRSTERVQRDDVYAGISSKLDDDLLNSQLEILEKVDW